MGLAVDAPPVRGRIATEGEQGLAHTRSLWVHAARQAGRRQAAKSRSENNWFFDVFSGSDSAMAIPGERVRPARRVWRPAKHIPASLRFVVNLRRNAQEPIREGVRRETRPTAIGAIALPIPCRFASSSTENVEEPFSFL
jgi:hypothetical protein